MTRDDIIEKFRTLAPATLAPAATDAIVEVVFDGRLDEPLALPATP